MALGRGSRWLTSMCTSWADGSSIGRPDSSKLLDDGQKVIAVNRHTTGTGGHDEVEPPAGISHLHQAQRPLSIFLINGDNGNEHLKPLGDAILLDCPLHGQTAAVQMAHLRLQPISRNARSINPIVKEPIELSIVINVHARRHDLFRLMDEILGGWTLTSISRNEVMEHLGKSPVRARLRVGH